MVAALKVYRVDADRDGQFWHIRVPQVARSTQARTLREIEPVARDLIAIMEDADPGSFELEVHLSLPEDVRSELETAARLRETAASAKSEAARLSRQAARRLHELGLPLRDVGTVLGISYQRAHQLVGESGPARDAASDDGPDPGLRCASLTG
jgi:hypothetical protein